MQCQGIRTIPGCCKVGREAGLGRKCEWRKIVIMEEDCDHGGHCTRVQKWNCMMAVIKEP